MISRLHGETGTTMHDAADMRLEPSHTTFLASNIDRKVVWVADVRIVCNTIADARLTVWWHFSQMAPIY